MLHICNECNYKRTCQQFLKDPTGLFCGHPDPEVRKEQEDRVEKTNYFGNWIPM